MSSSSYMERLNANKILDDRFKSNTENLPEYKSPNLDNADELKDRNIELSGYDVSRKAVYYDLKNKDGTIKRIYAENLEDYKPFF